MKGNIMDRKLLVLIIFTISFLNLYSQNQNYNEVVDYLKENGRSPDEYLIGKFKQYDVILLAEDHAIRDNLLFVKEMIPKLYQNGVFTIGMEFGAREQQHQLDSLLSADEYDFQMARDIMFAYNVGWAYQEYMDLYHAAWKLNRSLPGEAQKFRILNLSYQYDWSHFQGVRTPENMNQVFHKGTPDMYRAKVVEKEIIQEEEKILILTGTYHAFSKYQMPVYSEYSDYFCDFNNRMLGNRLYKKYQGKVTSIALHQPFPGKPNDKEGRQSPANGAVENIMGELDHQPMGFDLDSVVGDLPDNSYYSMGYPSFKVGQLFDGYIFLKPFSQLQGCEVDSQFFLGRDWEQIHSQIPDPDWRGDLKSLSEFRRQIESYVDLSKRYVELIK
ncbi:ChaN family lipoprotein [uncultured Sunxiuqinia sp.]|uniref:ChaN family lipoprotein n=1 Tax=uncultured Sunxiuqinia sp. TaxID=1573825 RepID=UPI0030D7F486|tara:strand:+ start:33395 stop:34552 length:1158 start_codon:yes stop_codon:yes gene_type:complete